MLSTFFSLFRPRSRLRVGPTATESDHQLAITLLTEQIIEPSDVAFPPLGGDLDHRNQGTILGAWDNDDLVAAAFVGPDVQSAGDAFMNGRPDYAGAFRQRIAVVHGIATDPERRQEGAARTLLSAIDTLATQQEYDVLIAVPTSNEAEQFFTQCGYLLFEDSVALMLQPKEAEVPITIPNTRRWAVRPLRDADRAQVRVGQALISPGTATGEQPSIRCRWLT